MGKWIVLGNSNYRRTVINPAHQEIFLRLVEMTLRLLHARYSLPEWQAVNLTFLAPCWKKQTFYVACFVLLLVLWDLIFVPCFCQNKNLDNIIFWTDHSDFAMVSPGTYHVKNQESKSTTKKSQLKNKSYKIEIAWAFMYSNS